MIRSSIFISLFDTEDVPELLVETFVDIWSEFNILLGQPFTPLGYNA